MQNSLKEQLEGMEDSTQRKLIEFLLRAAKDMVDELEMRQSIQGVPPLASPAKSPAKTLHHLPTDLVSPSKKRMGKETVSEDTIQRVKAAIESDPTLKNYKSQQEKPISLEKFVVVVSYVDSY